MADRSKFNRRRFLATGVALAASAVAGKDVALAQAPAIIKLPRKTTMKVATIVAESFPFYVDGLRFWKQEKLKSALPVNSNSRFFTQHNSVTSAPLTKAFSRDRSMPASAPAPRAGFVPAYNVVELPFLIKDMQHMYKLADGELGERIGQQAETKGFKVLAYYSTGDQHFQTRRAQIKTLADFKELKIRVIQNRAMVAKDFAHLAPCRPRCRIRKSTRPCNKVRSTAPPTTFSAWCRADSTRWRSSSPYQATWSSRAR